MASEVSPDQSTEVAPSIYRPRQNRAVVRDSRSMRRFIIKQGYLKKMPSTSRVGSFFKVISYIMLNVLNPEDMLVTVCVSRLIEMNYCPAHLSG